MVDIYVGIYAYIVTADECDYRENRCPNEKRTHLLISAHFDPIVPPM